MVALQSSAAAGVPDQGLSLRQATSIVNLVMRDGITDEKPSTLSTSTLAIALGVSIPCAIAIAIFIWLHRRNVKRQRMEDADGADRDLDFGIDHSAIPAGKKKKTRASILMSSEKPSHKTSQLSMDMNLESPYLLPPQAHASQDSVHTLTRNHEYDPYRIVNSESGSIRSFNNRDPSIFGGASSKRASVLTGKSGFMPPPRQGSFPKQPPSANAPYPNEKSDPFATPPPSMPAPAYQPSSPELASPPKPAAAVPYPDEAGVAIPDVQEPPAAVPKSPVDRAASPPSPAPQIDNIGVAHPGDAPHAHDQGAPALGLDFDLPKSGPLDEFTFSDNHNASNNRLSVNQPLPGQAVSDNRLSKTSDYGDQDGYPQVHTSEYHDAHYDNHGQAAEMGAAADANQQSQGLGVPQQDNRRISIGMRPLPPSDVTDAEDPEYRANRIRSFYKEYFEDTTAQAPPMPSMPAAYGASGGGGAQYYEDYDQQYLGEAAYFDPDSNAFVMPGAQPVHRRAMTPPPSNRRGPPGPGPRGPGGRPGPHGPHGSMSGMRPRAGSSWGRAASSLGPRPDSSASARPGRQTPRKNLPPPAPLNTLPTPSKLRDDSFAIINAGDFAPPESFGSRAAGRSQSPLGERRPYSPALPPASPLVTSYDELNALPSP